MTVSPNIVLLCGPLEESFAAPYTHMFVRKRDNNYLPTRIKGNGAHVRSPIYDEHLLISFSDEPSCLLPGLCNALTLTILSPMNEGNTSSPHRRLLLGARKPQKYLFLYPTLEKEPGWIMPIGVSIGLPKYHIASSFPLNTACVPFLFFSSLQSCLYGGCSVQMHSFQLLGALTRRTPTRCGGHFGKLPTRIYTRRKLRLHFRTARMVETRPQPANCLSNFISEDIHRAVGTCWLGVTGR